MKKQFALLVTTLFFAVALKAQNNITMLHHGGIVSTFSGTIGFVNAYNAASTGDTIYLGGGIFTTPTTYNKGLIVFGAGYNIDSSIVTGATTAVESARGTFFVGGRRQAEKTTINKEMLQKTILCFIKLFGFITLTLIMLRSIIVNLQAFLIPEYIQQAVHVTITNILDVILQLLLILIQLISCFFKIV